MTSTKSIERNRNQDVVDDDDDDDQRTKTLTDCNFLTREHQIRNLLSRHLLVLLHDALRTNEHVPRNDRFQVHERERQRGFQEDVLRGDLYLLAELEITRRHAVGCRVDVSSSSRAKIKKDDEWVLFQRCGRHERTRVRGFCCCERRGDNFSEGGRESQGRRRHARAKE